MEAPVLRGFFRPEAASRVSRDDKVINTSRLQTALFLAYLALFPWLPVPLGSKYPWAISVMEIWIYSLAIATALMLASGGMGLSNAFRKNLPAVLLLGLTTFWIAFQQMPLSESMLSLLSPRALEIYRQAHSPDMSIALNPAITWLAFLKALSLFLLFVLTLILVNTPTRLRWLAYAIVSSAFIQAIAAIILNLSDIQFSIEQYTYSSILDIYRPSGRATGFQSNPDHLAGLMEMSLAVGIGLLISMLRSIEFHSWRQRLRHYSRTLLGPKARLRLILLTLCIALVMTHSRMGNTAFFSSLLIAGGLFLALSRHAPRAVSIFLISLMLLDIFVVGSVFGFRKLADRIEQTTIANEASRVDVYDDTLAMTADFRISGIGSGNFFTAFPAYKVNGPTYYIDHVHNDYLEFLLELGVIGAAPLALLLLLSLWITVTNLRRRHSRLMLGMSFASLMGVISILIHSSVDFNLQVPANAALFTTLIALPFICRQLSHRV